jgi:acid stress-induced BolA-like protein IbaG/YrbA
MQGINLKIKVIVSQLFREILNLKGSKMIYANILIDTIQNKYIRLEPIDNPNTINR